MKPAPGTAPRPSDGLFHALCLDGRGGAVALDWAGVRAWVPEHGTLWVHLDRSGEAARRWVSEASGLDPITADALLSSQSRPRYVYEDGQLLLTLRGVNLNPGADPEDMVSMRLHAGATRVISLRRERVMAADIVRERLARGAGPTGPGQLLAQTIGGLIERMAPVIDDLNERIDELEDGVVDPEQVVSREDLVPLRRELITLRRFLAPQRQALGALAEEPVAWFTDADAAAVRESANRLARYVEDLDAVRDRAVIVHEELSSERAERLNARIYVLTVIAAIVLPLSLVTGALGMNVAGIPWSDSPWSFAAVCGLLVALGLGLVLLLRRVEWL